MMMLTLKRRHGRRENSVYCRHAMQKSLFSIVKDKERNTFQKEELIVSVVPTVTKGFTLAKELLYTLVDSHTVLYLSGGKTEVIKPGVVGLVDERYGGPLHPSSNERMLKDTGFLRYLELLGIPFYPMLHTDKSREEIAELYDQKFREFNTTYHKSIATLGIGVDGHTAGIAGNRKDFHNPMFDLSQKDTLVSEYDDPVGLFKERVSMTFLGLSMMDVLVVLVFGEDKKSALIDMFSDGSEEEVPARFLRRSSIAKKTVLITDQNIL
jgi:6-phosphogluconolactonase/glucosamine-6-phosphate isomerase/deaminase